MWCGPNHNLINCPGIILLLLLIIVSHLISGRPSTTITFICTSRTIWHSTGVAHFEDQRHTDRNAKIPRRKDHLSQQTVDHTSEVTCSMCGRNVAHALACLATTGATTRTDHSPCQSVIFDMKDNTTITTVVAIRSRYIYLI